MTDSVKVPANVKAVDPENEIEKYIGQPYTSVPNPFDTEHETTPSTSKLNSCSRSRSSASKWTTDIRRTCTHPAQYKRRYHRGRAEEKRNIRHPRQLPDTGRTGGERDAYFPASTFCPECGRDTTKITIRLRRRDYASTNVNADTRERLTLKDSNCKLAWKIDWPMRWRYEGVDFEPGGKDHASPGGSYETSSVITRKIFRS